jgi:hypothetical protein
LDQRLLVWAVISPATCGLSLRRDSDNWYQSQTNNLGSCTQGDLGAPVSLCGRPVMNGVGSLTRELGCAHEPVRQAELRRHQCVTGEIVGMVPY